MYQIYFFSYYLNMGHFLDNLNINYNSNIKIIQYLIYNVSHMCIIYNNNLLYNFIVFMFSIIKFILVHMNCFLINLYINTYYT